MKTAILIVAGFVAVVLLLLVIVAIAGAMLPRNHKASRSIVLARPPAEVYAVIRDFESAPKWRTDLKSVEVTPQPDGQVHFREVGKQGAINFELAEDLPGKRMVTRILDKDLGYAGTWTFALTAEQNGTRLTITEDGEVSNVIFRFMSKYVFGQTATIDSYLTALEKHFGDKASPK